MLLHHLSIPDMQICMNCMPGPDGIHPKALKELAEILARPLTIIFDISIQTGIVPDLWKIGHIIALFKKGDKSDPGNYRPVSLVGKFMDKIVRKVIVNHMIKYDFIVKNNFDLYWEDQRQDSCC